MEKQTEQKIREYLESFRIKFTGEEKPGSSATLAELVMGDDASDAVSEEILTNICNIIEKEEKQQSIFTNRKQIIEAIDEYWKDGSSPQTVLSAPNRHSLEDVLKELKFGRTVEDQKALQYFINVLQGFELKSDKDFNGLLSCGKATFGMAIEALKQGKRVARKGWNGKGMFLYLVRGTMVDKENLRNEASMQPIEDHTGTVTFLAHIDMFTAQKTVNVGWLASQTDMLSEDWEIVD